MGGASGSASALPCPGFSASDFFVSVATLRRFLSGFVFSISQSRTKHGIRVAILRRVAKTGFRGSDFLLRSISVFFQCFPGLLPKKPAQNCNGAILHRWQVTQNTIAVLRRIPLPVEQLSVATPRRLLHYY